jgi:4-amino-4-deoxy-L-arabinose transferase-like glycosyltransferase
MKRLLSLLITPRYLLLAILFLALALRLFGLTFHSLWLDESVALKWARLPVAEILERTTTMREDAHPPLSYLALHGWIRAFGDSEQSLRGHMAALGFLVVVLVYLLGKEIAGQRAGLIVALLAAISPYLIWYSQEVRMYGLLGTLSVAAVYCLWRGLREGRPIWWALYLLAAVGGVYTSVIGALLIPFHALAILFYPARQRRWTLLGVAAVALAGLSFLPLAALAWQASGVITTERVAPSLLTLLTTTPVILLLRQVPVGWQWLAVPGAALAIVGWATTWRRSWRIGLIVLSYTIVPLGLIFALSLWRLPIFGQPYIIAAAPALLLAAALGVEALWRRRQAAGAAALLALCAVSLFAVRYDWQRSMGKEDWRAAAQYISAHALPGDAIVVVPYYARLPLAYYYRGDLPILEPFSDPVAPEAIAPALQGIEQYGTVWLVLSHAEQLDPQGLVRRWLMERYPVLTEQYPRGVEIRALATRYRLPASPDVHPIAVFGDGLRLLAAHADAQVAARDDIYHPPSGWVHVRLQWQSLAAAKLAGSRVRLRVIDSIGQVWGERLERQSEVWRFYPPERWLPNEIVSDAYDVNMNPVTPPGRYRVELQVLDSSGRVLPVQADGMPADRFFVAEVEVR